MKVQKASDICVWSDLTQDGSNVLVPVYGIVDCSI